ncbi:hypothetical protein Tco_0926964 [Tanacetum coccineum]|uniref:Uncharacterized protein n=1 Tax=Tanacetum coccineum TaxID=301880 RepID=A0ABQ5DBA0_9ASTR
MSNTNNNSDIMDTKDTVSSCSVSNDQEMQRLHKKALFSKAIVMEDICSRKENSNSETAFSKSVLSKEDLKGTRIEHGFKQEFMSLFGQDDDTFTTLDAGLVVTESSRADSEVQDESSKSGNDTDIDDADC